MRISENYELANGESLFLTFENGQHVVYDRFEYEHYENATPRFTGHYEKCIAFIEQCERDALEETLF